MINYDVVKENGGRYYVCNINNPKVAISGTYKKEKKDALKIAARYEGLPYKDYLKARKERVS